ncbi:MAG: YebC/PmpR family DNA-binding transcriptional regulator [Coriobacteriia bacterium]|nr:YebC/PmpR family DNA-binding transcriptional regulator [Coriobacteriia bacterium]
MSGHSKWATTKHRKAAQDAKRSALFSKLSRMITVAAKLGGDPSPENNAQLAAAVEKARSYSMPKDKIQAAIDKAFGAGADAASYEEIVYEGYGPDGVAIYVEALTDNRNRTAADVRSAFTRAGGNLAGAGAVAFQFERTGEIVIDKSGAPDEEDLLLLVADAGGNDLEDNDEEFVVTTDPADLARVRDALVAAGVPVKGAELSMRPKTPVKVSVETAKKVLRLVDVLEENDDIQEVYHNMELTEELAAALEEH